MLRFLAFSVLLAASLSECLVLQPPENQWVLHGQEVKLLCKSSEPINTCTWSTPYNSSYTLSPGLVAEKGRLKHFATDEEKECGILITKVEHQDHGAWMCNVGTIMNSEVQSASGEASVEMARKPKSIKLSEPFHTGAVSLSEVSSNQESAVKCIVAEARPKPVFSWYIGDEELSDLDTEEQEDESTWTQTLLYKPEAGHANRSLRCVVEHIALGDDDSKQAEVLLQFTPSDKELLINKSANAHVPLIVVSVIVPVFLIFVFTCSYFNQHIFVRKSSADVSLEDEDVEKNANIDLDNLEAGNAADAAAASDSAPGQEKENKAFEAEEKNEAAVTAEEEQQQPKSGLKERMASFFRFGAAATAAAAAAKVDEEAVKVEEIAEKVEQVAEKVVEAAEKVEEVAAKVAEAAEKVEDVANKAEVEVVKETAAKSGSGIAKIFKLFKGSKKPQAEVAEAAVEGDSDKASDEEKVKADEAENEKGEDAKEEKQAEEADKPTAASEEGEKPVEEKEEK